MLEHIADTQKAVSSIISCLRPSGAAYLLVPDGRADNSGHHIHFWSQESWELTLNKIVGTDMTIYNTTEDQNMPQGHYLTDIVKTKLFKYLYVPKMTQKWVGT